MGVGHFVDYIRLGSDGQPLGQGSTAIYRAGLIVTTSYVAGTAIDTAFKYDQIVILWGFTKGSLTSGELKIEFSPDNTTWYQETFESVSGGTATDSLGEHTQTATGNYRLAIPIADRYIRISVKGTGTVTSSSASLDVILAIN